MVVNWVIPCLTHKNIKEILRNSLAMLNIISFFVYRKIKTDMKKLTASVLAVVLTASFTVVSAQQDTLRTQEIEGVVVTALGIKREKRSLGYSTTEVKGDQVASAPVANVSDALAGQVAGLNVQRSEEHTSELQSRENLV